MAFVLVAGAQPADEHLTLAAEELLQVLVLGADLLSQVAGGRDELMLLQGLLGLMGLQVGLAVRAHAHQAAFDRPPPLSFANVASHRRGGELLFGSRRGGCKATGASQRLTHVSFEGPFAELFHSLSQHGVPGQGGLRAEGLAALGATVDPFGVVFAPVVLDAGHAVAVSTGDGDRIIWEFQTHGAVKLLFCPQFGAHPDPVKAMDRRKEARESSRNQSRILEEKVKRCRCLDSQEETAGSQVRAERGETGGARATGQVKRGKLVSVENEKV